MSATRRKLAPHALAMACTVLLLACGDAFAAGLRIMSVEQAREAAQSGSLVLVDIRTPGEWRDSGVPDVAVPLDMTQPGFVQKLLALRGDDPEMSLGLICATGRRSGAVANWLQRNGILNVVDVPAGVHTRDGWLARQLPVQPPERTTPRP